MEIFFKKRIFWSVVVLFINGCAVGPDFKPPPSPQLSRYTEKPLPAKTVSAPSQGGYSQTLITSRDLPAEWWALFHSADLNKLVVRGITNSPNLQSAVAALREAEQNLRAREGQLFPSINLNASAFRERISTASFGLGNSRRGSGSGSGSGMSGSTIGGASSAFNLYNTTVNVSYTLDLFGGIRRQLESLAAQVDYQQYQWDAAYLTLIANIVTTAITEASLREQISATLSLISEQARLLHIVRQQLKLGGVSGVEVLAQSTQLAQLRATLPPLQLNLAKNRDALAALVGALPPESGLPEIHLSDLKLPHRLPITLPSQLVCQRPDVQASEALLHAASAQIGVATANLLPQITLSAAYGWVGTGFSNFFSNQNTVWSYGAQLIQPLFQGGALMAKRRAAFAAYDQALAQYRQTVLVAFQNVADALNAIAYDTMVLRAETQAETSARANFILNRNQYKLGGVSYLSLLSAQVQYQEARINRIKAEAARYTDTAALFQALGGGWWHVGVDTTRRD